MPFFESETEEVQVEAPEPSVVADETQVCLSPPPFPPLSSNGHLPFLAADLSDLSRDFRAILGFGSGRVDVPCCDDQSYE